MDRPVMSCAEPHAFENLKNSGASKADVNVTLKIADKGRIEVVKPCGNCKAMGDHYGKVPFEKYHGSSVKDAVTKHVGQAKEALGKANAATAAKCTKYPNAFANEVLKEESSEDE